MSDTPTPETDAFVLSESRTDHGWRTLARRLERERDEARADVARLREGIDGALMHLLTNYDIDGNSMGDSDAADSLRRALAAVLLGAKGGEMTSGNVRLWRV
jgi:hypothetical protein